MRENWRLPARKKRDSYSRLTRPRAHVGYVLGLSWSLAIEEIKLLLCPRGASETPFPLFLIRRSLGATAPPCDGCLSASCYFHFTSLPPTTLRLPICDTLHHHFQDHGSSSTLGFRRRSLISRPRGFGTSTAAPPWQGVIRITSDIYTATACPSSETSSSPLVDYASPSRVSIHNIQQDGSSRR